MNQQTRFSTEHTTIDVLIVGAGPTGLAAALELARRGITFRLIEKNMQRSPYSKALGLHARTLELLELQSASLVDTFVREGYTTPGANLSTGGNSVVADFSSLDTRYPYLLIVPQARTEELLEAHLTELDRAVERGVELKTLTQGTEHVTVHLQHANGQIEEVHARYVLGCDGAHSAVRHASGLPFPGRGYPWTAFLGDVKIDGEMAKRGLTQFSNERGLALLFPFQDGYSRVITLDIMYQNSSVREDLTLDELQDSVNALLPVPTRLSEPRWLARWSAQLRQVPRYRVGRVFVAGDAAHVHSPAGGQGLNTGLQDALNLAWKLALVLRGQAPESLLDTYQAERHPVGQQVLRTSDILLRSAFLPNNLIREGRNVVVKMLIPIPLVQRLLSEDLSGLGISYHHADPRSQLFKLFANQQARQVGDRVPDLELKPAVLTAETSTTMRLYDLLRQVPYSLFIEIAPERFEEDRQQLVSLLERVGRFAGEMIKPYVIFGQGAETITRNLDVAALIDFKQQFRHKLGTHHGDIVLIRPDGYLALRVPELRQEQLLSELRSWVTPALVKREAAVN